MLKKLLLVGALVLSFSVVTSVASADAVSDLQAKISAVMAQIQSLQARLNTAQGNPSAQNVQATVVSDSSTTGSSASDGFCYNFTRNLSVGSANADATALIKILTNAEGLFDGSSETYDENVAATVVDFQTKYGIKKTGTVGPLTRAKLNSLYKCGRGNTPPTIPPIVVPSVPTTPPKDDVVSAASIVTLTTSKTPTSSVVVPVVSSEHSAQAFTVKINNFDRTQKDPVKWTQAFYAQHPGDNWDYLLFFTTPNPYVGSGEYVLIKNDVRGIGETILDFSSSFGSAARLHGVGFLFTPSTPSPSLYNLMLHESLGHAFGVYGRDSLGESLVNPPHWSPCMNFSAPDGIQYWNTQNWHNNGNGTWSYPVFSNEVRLNRLDPFLLYFAGLIPATDVLPATLLLPTGGESDCRLQNPVTATTRTITINDVIAQYGPRIPSFADSQKGFAIALVLLTDANETPSADTLEKMSVLAADWPSALRAMSSSVSVLPPLVVDLRVNNVANAVTVPSGSSVELSWTATNGNSCILDGANVGPSGTVMRNVGVYPTTVYSIVCHQSGGDSIGVSDNITVTTSGATNSSKPLVAGCGSIGDVNESGDISQADFDLLTDYLVNGTTLTDSQKRAADTNGNGVVSNSDRVAISNYLNGISITFPACVMVQPSLTLTTPNGGQTFARGSVQPIRWTRSGTFPAGSIQRVRLLKTVGNTQNIYSLYTFPANSTDTSYSWTNIDKDLFNTLIPDGSDYKVQVIVMASATDSTKVASDESDAGISVISSRPLVAGCGSLGDADGNNNISMTDYNLIGNFVAGLQVPTDIQRRNADTDANGSLTMTDQVSIGAYLSGGITTFKGCPAVSQAPVTVDLKANGQDTLTVPANSDINLSWTSANADVCYFRNITAGTSNVTGLTGPITQNVGSGSSVVYEVSCARGSETPVADRVAVTITPVTTPASVTVDLRVNSVADAITLTAGNTATLSWTTTNASGCVYDGANVGTNDSRTLTIPSSSSITYSINCYGPGSTGPVSDQVAVTIIPAPVGSVTVVSPNTNELWKTGETHTITWTSSGLSPSDRFVLYLVNAGGMPIGPNIAVLNFPATSYDWAIPQTVTTGTDYRIQVGVSGKGVQDTSDTSFRIINPTLGRPSACGSVGDLNGDGVISTTDWDLAGQAAAGVLPMTDALLHATDVNGSGSVSMTDWTMVGRYVSGLIDTFPACATVSSAGNLNTANQMAGVLESVRVTLEGIKSSLK